MEGLKINSAGYIRCSILLVFLIFTQTGILAQEPYLSLSKINKVSEVTFYEGETIRFRLKGEKYFIEEHILGLSGDEIRFHYFVVNVRDIDVVDIRGKDPSNTTLRMASGKLIFAGIALIGIDQLNQVVIRDEPAGVSTGIAITSAAIVGAGVAMRLIEKKYFRVGKKSIIQIIEPRDQSITSR